MSIRRSLCRKKNRRPNKGQPNRVPILDTQTRMLRLPVDLRNECPAGDSETNSHKYRDCPAESLTIIRDRRHEVGLRPNLQSTRRVVGRVRVFATIGGQLAASE